VPVEKGIRRTMRAKMKAMKHLFRAVDEVKMDLGEADKCFDVIRAVNFVARYRDAYEKNKELLGPNIRANYEIGAKMTLADFAWAHGEQTRIFRKFQELYRDYDLVMSPTVGVTPFPWKQLYVEEMEGKKLRNYYHWLAPTYWITLATNPADRAALRCRPRGHAVRPAGDRPLPRRRRGAGRAHAMEQAFRHIPGLARPVPDIARLRKPTPELKSIVTHPPKLNARPSRGPAPGAAVGKTGGVRHPPATKKPGTRTRHITAGCAPQAVHKQGHRAGRTSLPDDIRRFFDRPPSTTGRPDGG